RAGVAEQRHPPRARRRGHRGGATGRSRRAGAARRRRQRPPDHDRRDHRRPRRRPRARRHARARGHARRAPAHRSDPRRRLRRVRDPPAGGRVTIRVLIVDDHGMVRSGFAAYLGAQDDIEVVGEAADGAEGVRLAAEQRPDVVLMDVRMPVMDGIAATRAILADDVGGEPPRVLVLTTFDLDEHVYAALRAGASGFLLKDASAGELADAVRVVAAGDAVISPSVTRRLIAEFARLGGPRAPTRTRLEELTERETEVLALVGQGLSNAEIAEHLVISGETVKTHVSRILWKLGLRDRAQAIVFAYESGIVRPDH